MKSILKDVLGGATTFFTLSYIIVVQPIILSSAGADFYSVLFATTVSTAISTLIMGAITGYPFAIAPAMGHNLFFVSVVKSGVDIKTALFINFLSGILFLVVSITGLSRKIVSSIPQSLRAGIGAGIGLLLAFVGLQWGGILKIGEEISISLSKYSIITFSGLIIISALYLLKIPGAVMIGIIFSVSILFITKDLKPPEFFYALPEIPKIPAFDIRGLLESPISLIVSSLIIFFILDLFDTAGTLVGLLGIMGKKLEDEDKKIDKVFISDAIGTIIGTILGTSTLTTYVESAAGIKAGAKSFISSIPIFILMILSLIFFPVFKALGTEIYFEGMSLHIPVAPALIFVGFLMMQTIKDIDWEDTSQSFPAFITIISTALTLSITDGIAYGFISYTILKIITGKIKDLNPIIILSTILLTLKFIL